MKRLTLLSLVLVSTSGCHLLIGHLMSASAYKDALKSAPVIPNPAKTGVATDTVVVGNDGVAYQMSVYSAKEACFDAQLPEAPAAVQGSSFELQALQKAEDDRGKAPKQLSSSIRVLESSNELVPVTKRVTDTIRDSSGRVVATQDRQVQELERHYKTQARICFAKPALITPDTRYLVMVPTASKANAMWTGMDTFAVWRLD
jgi:hypothetical protein